MQVIDEYENIEEYENIIIIAHECLNIIHSIFEISALEKNKSLNNANIIRVKNIISLMGNEFFNYIKNIFNINCIYDDFNICDLAKLESKILNYLIYAKRNIKIINDNNYSKKTD